MGQSDGVTAHGVTIHSAIACPFSHRTRMALSVKGVGYETVEVDLLKPPTWFTEGPARTQMPMLVTEEITVHGASTANEYIDERWKEPPLLPGPAASRADARGWINWLEEKLQPTYEAALLEIDGARYERHRKSLDSVLQTLERRLRVRIESEGWSPSSYWHGERLGMVDLSYAATFVRFAGLAEFHGWEMPADLPAVTAWIGALGSDPVVRDTFREAEVLARIGSYLDMFRAMAGG
jgi:glutathione S-transferase